MNTIEKATFQDLIDENACIGPDGGIWYPSGPSDVPAAKIFTALVNEARSHRKTLAHCKFEFDRAEKAERERNVLADMLGKVNSVLPGMKPEYNDKATWLEWAANEGAKGDAE